MCLLTLKLVAGVMPFEQTGHSTACDSLLMEVDPFLVKKSRVLVFFFGVVETFELDEVLVMGSTLEGFTGEKNFFDSG
jgi:hypothetical protein